MKKEEIKKLVKSLRKENNELCNRYNSDNIYISFSLQATTGEIMEINPYSLNLRNGSYFGRDLIDGEYKNVRLWKWENYLKD